MKALVDFMYIGEVSVEQSKLQCVLDAGQELKVNVYVIYWLMITLFMWFVFGLDKRFDGGVSATRVAYIHTGYN